MINITTLRPGEHFMFKGFEWVCLDTNHPDGGTAESYYLCKTCDAITSCMDSYDEYGFG